MTTPALRCGSRFLGRAVAVSGCLGFAALAAPVGADANLAHLFNLRGAHCTVRYTPGSLDRAAHVQARLDALAEDFAKWGGARVELVAYILGPEDWHMAGLRQPYGMPEAVGPNAVAMPAWGDDRTIALWRGLLGGPLPWSSGTPVRGTPEEAASLAAADLVAQVEIARQFVDRERLASGAPWVHELLAATVARAAFERREAVRIGEIEGFFAQLGRTAGPEPPSPPIEFREGLAAAARFFAGAPILLRRDKGKTVSRLTKLARKSDGPLAVGDWVGRYPELSVWLSGPAAAP